MNKIICVLLTSFALSGTSVYAQQELAIDSSYDNSWYQQRLAYFRKMPDKKKEIIFLGNSITEQGEWQEVIYKNNVLNRGISGDVTYGILARLDEVLSSKPSKLFVLMGINDMKRGTPNDLIKANYERLIKRVQKESPGTKLYMQGLLPINKTMLPESYSKLSNEKIDALNDALKSLCLSYKVTYIDLHPVMEDQNGQLKKEYSIDGLHLKSAAYKIWADYLRKVKAI